MTRLLKSLLAKKNDRNVVSLYDHSVAVAEMSYCLIDKLIKEEFREETESLYEEVYLSGLLHDIGKCSSQFQEYLNSGNKEYIFHNVLGGSIIDNFIKFDDENVSKRIIKTVLYHHPITNDITELSIGNEIRHYKDIVNEMLEIFYKKFPVSLIRPILNDIDEIEEVSFVPNYYGEEKKKRSQIVGREAKFFIISNVIRFADYIVSSGIDYNRIINRKNTIGIEEIVKPDGYDSRFDKQFDYAKSLVLNDVNIFDCQTGFGKTMLGLLYTIMANNKKTYWVCPRNSIANGVYKTLVKEITNLGLSDRLSVGLLLTNEYKEGNADSDIIVTNIDNFMRPMIKNDTLIRTYTMIHANCIFDEFHEYIMDAPLMAFFDIINKGRRILNTKTLYLSATPILNFFDRNINIVRHNDETILNRRYKISFSDVIPDTDFCNKNYFIATNSVTKCQDFKNELKVNNLIHTRYLDSDNKVKLSVLIEEHGNKRNISNSSWSATNIISTGIDISFDNVTVISPIPDKFIQTIGRCNRWNDGKEEHHILLCKHTTHDRSEEGAIRQIFDKDLCDLFYNLLKDKLANKEYITFSELYNIREEFYKLYSEDFKTFFNSKINESYDNLRKIRYNFSNSIEESDKKVIGKNILRGTEEQFYCKFDGFEETYIGDKKIFSKIFDKKISVNERKVILNYILNKIKGNKEYFKHKRQYERLCNKGYEYIMDELISKAKNKETPLIIPPSLYIYDTELGIIKNY